MSEHFERGEAILDCWENYGSVPSFATLYEVKKIIPTRNDWTGVWRCESRQSSNLILSAGNMGGVNFEKNLKESD